MNFRSGKNHMNSGPFSVTKSFPGRVDIGDAGASQSGNSYAACMGSNLSDGQEITWRSRRKTGFDDIHIEARELLGNLNLLFSGHSGSWRLFAIAQGCVKNSTYRRV